MFEPINIETPEQKPKLALANELVIDSSGTVFYEEDPSETVVQNTENPNVRDNIEPIDALFIGAVALFALGGSVALSVQKHRRSQDA
jgi:hypothetical protein